MLQRKTTFDALNLLYYIYFTAPDAKLLYGICSQTGIGSCKCNVYQPGHWIEVQSNMKMFWMDPTPDLTKFPADVFIKFPRLKELRLPDDTELQTIEKSDFENATELTTFRLRNSKLKSIPAEAFSPARRLRHIDLSKNKIEEIKNDAFKYLTKLNTLDLSDNLIKIVQNAIFSHLRSLEELNLNNNHIETIEEDAFKLQNLEKLLLSHNKIQTLPDKVFSNAPSLLHLELISANLNKTENAFKHLTELKTLYLGNNNETKLHLKDFIELPNLVTLSLRNTSLDISSELASTAHTSGVLVLDLASNKINDSQIFDKLIAFKKLEQINLEYNDLKNISNIGNITKHFESLSEIYLFGNQNLDPNTPKKADKIEIIVDSKMNSLSMKIDEEEEDSKEMELAKSRRC